MLVSMDGAVFCDPPGFSDGSEASNLIKRLIGYAGRSFSFWIRIDLEEWNSRCIDFIVSWISMQREIHILYK